MASQLAVGITIFLISTLVIGIVGVRLAKIADVLADVTKVGEALVGAVLVGSVTSLPGIVTSVAAAWQGYPELAISNAIGGIILQTSFLAVADLLYNRANLEHAAASLPNIMQGMLLILLLTMILGARFIPEATILNVNFISPLLIVVYIMGIKLITSAGKKPMWLPAQTQETVEDVPHHQIKKSKTKVLLWVKFFSSAVIIAIAGYSLTQAGIMIVQTTALSQSFIGGLLTAGSSSLPELVITIAAVRQNALTLAVGNIIGGNTFDTLFVVFADLAYRHESIYTAMSSLQIVMILVAIVMTVVLILGLLHRQKKGPVKIGWESVTILMMTLAIYVFIYFN